MKLKKKQITLISLLVLLVALIFVYIFVVVPLMNKGTDNESVIPQDGEGVYLGRISIYPKVSTSDAISIKVSNSYGELTVDMSGEKPVISEYPSLELSEFYSNIVSYALSPTSTDNEVYRNLSDEKMAEYGVTPDTALANYVLTYKDGEQIKTLKVYIGRAVFSSTESYYAALEGRNSVYRFYYGAKDAFLSPIEDFIYPVVSNQLSQHTQTEIITFLRSMVLATSDTEGTLERIVQIVGLPFSDSADNTKINFKVSYPDSIDADVSYVAKVSNTLFPSFAGEKTVKLNPSEEMKKEYGVSADSQRYVISTVFELPTKSDGVNNDIVTSTIVLSELKDGYYYTISPYYKNLDGLEVLVKIPQSSLSFLRTDEDGINKWMKSSSAAFEEYLSKNQSANAPGVKSISINAPSIGFNDTFNLNGSAEQGGYITVTLDKSEMVFRDGTDKTSNQFRHFYDMLLRLPNFLKFSNLSNEETEKTLGSENLVFEMTAVLNNNTVKKYEYFRIENSQYLLCRYSEGTATDGIYNFSSVRCSFLSSLEQTDKICKSLKDLMDGKTVSAYN